MVEKWRDEKIYPYEGEPTNVVERAGREVFDVLALNVNTYLPEFSTSDEKTKRFQFRLLRQAVERSGRSGTHSQRGSGAAHGKAPGVGRRECPGGC